MNRQVALLRGINVGSRNRVGMADLRELLEGLGYQRVRTHLQSGNAIFDAPTRPDRTAARIASVLTEQLGLEVPVLVRTPEQLASVIAADPLGGAASNPSRYLVQFLPTEPPPDALDTLDPTDFEPERYALIGRELYLWLPDGVHSAKLPVAVGRLGLTGTARNWKTVLRLLELARE